MNVLVAHDGSAQADKALSTAAKIAEKFGGSLTIVNVVPDLCLSSEELGPEACDAVAGSLQKDADASMRRVKDSLAAKGIQAGVVVTTGHPAEAILATAEERKPDLIVVGSTGRTGATRFFLGSVSSKVAEHAACDVLIVK